MAVKDTVGSVKKVVLDGLTFTAAADADFKQPGSGVTNDAVAGAGRNMRKQTAKVETVEGVDLLTNGAEQEQLRQLAMRPNDIAMSYTTAAGDIYRATGWIDVESRGTQDGKTSIKMFPRTTWEPFLA